MYDKWLNELKRIMQVLQVLQLIHVMKENVHAVQTEWLAGHQQLTQLIQSITEDSSASDNDLQRKDRLLAFAYRVSRVVSAKLASLEASGWWGEDHLLEPDYNDMTSSEQPQYTESPNISLVVASESSELDVAFEAVDSVSASKKKKPNVKPSQKKKLQSLMDQGEAAFDALDYLGALEKANEALMIHSRYLPALRLRISACLQLDDWPRVREDIATIELLDRVLAITMKVYLELRCGDPAVAERLFQTIINRLSREERLEIVGEFIDCTQLVIATAHCLELLAEKPECELALCQLWRIGDQAMVVGDRETAVRCFTRLNESALEKFNVLARYKLGLLQARYGSYRSAFEYFLSIESTETVQKWISLQQQQLYFGLWLCCVKLSFSEGVLINMQRLAQCDSRWTEVMLRHWIVVSTDVQNLPLPSDIAASDSMLRVYILGDLLPDMHLIILPFLRSDEFTHNLILLFDSLNADIVTQMGPDNKVWQTVSPKQLNHIEVYHPRHACSGLIALLSNPVGLDLFSMNAYLREKVTAKSLNAVVPYGFNQRRSALLCLVNSQTGLRLLANDASLREKITSEALNGLPLGGMETVSPLYLCALSQLGRLVLELNPSLRGKISREGLIEAMGYGLKYQTNPVLNGPQPALPQKKPTRDVHAAKQWLMNQLHRPHYQSLGLHQRLLGVPRASDQVVERRNRLDKHVPLRFFRIPEALYEVCDDEQQHDHNINQTWA